MFAALVELEALFRMPRVAVLHLSLLEAAAETVKPSALIGISALGFELPKVKRVLDLCALWAEV